MYRPTSVWGWAFLATACFQALFTIIVDSFLLYRINQGLISLSIDTDSDVESSRRHALGLTPMYLVILILGSLYHAWLSWDTLRLQNTIQICGVCSFAAALATYSMAEVIQVRSAISYFRLYVPESEPLLTAAESGLLVAIPVVLAITTLGLCVLAWKLSQTFAWTMYKTFSADVDVKKRYKLLEVSNTRALLVVSGDTDHCRHSSTLHCLNSTSSSFSASRYNFSPLSQVPRACKSGRRSCTLRSARFLSRQHC
jgi:hypothetical protein